MANVKKGQLTPPPEWWNHLRFCKRLFWRRERMAGKTVDWREVALYEASDRSQGSRAANAKPQSALVSEQKRYWRVRGYDGIDLIMDEMIPVGSMSDMQLKDCLKCLAAKTGLSFGEIIGAYAKRKTKIANDLLIIRLTHPVMMTRYGCGCVLAQA